ncbi:hypothetical protein KI387_024084, partial [Taxus chinensis]
VQTQVANRLTEHQKKVKIIFDKKAKERKFEVNDWVLLWDKRREAKGMHGKFDSLWKGPFVIKKIAGVDNFILSHQDGVELP